MAMVVTGAAGFIGSHLVEALASHGYDVVGIDRREGTPSAARDEIIADLTGRVPAVLQVLAGAEAVWHLAGCPGVRSSARDIAERRRADNILAGAMVLNSTPHSVPLVVVSSSSVYGGALHGGRARPSRESDPLRPIGGYARSKASLEALARRRAAEGGRVAIARPFTVAGERQRPDMALARWIEQARNGHPLTVFGSPARMRDVTDVRDAVEGLTRMVERGAQGVFNLGAGVRRSLADMAAAVADAHGLRLEFELQAAADGEVAVTWASIDRARRELDYDPNTDLLDIVRRQAGARELV